MAYKFPVFNSHLWNRLRVLPSILISRGKSVEEQKAGKKWDEIVEELKKRK